QARDGPRTPRLPAALGQRGAVEHDLLAVELVLAVPQRHPRRARVGPDAGEHPRLGLKADDAQAGGLPLVLAEDELRPEEPAVVDHRLAALAPRPRRLAGTGEE